VTRRNWLAAAAAAFALDPERALWVKGAKTISIPATVADRRLRNLTIMIAAGAGIGLVAEIDRVEYCSDGGVRVYLKSAWPRIPSPSVVIHAMDARSVVAFAEKWMVSPNKVEYSAQLARGPSA
jgi:hypothetical protein